MILERLIVKDGILNIVLSQFNFEMQYLLEDFLDKKLDFEQLLTTYNEIGTEKHDITKYRSLLEISQLNPEGIRLHAGFLPHPCAQNIVKKGLK